MTPGFDGVAAGCRIDCEKGVTRIVPREGEDAASPADDDDDAFDNWADEDEPDSDE